MNVSSKNKLQLNLEDALTRKIFTDINYKNIVRALQQGGIDITRRSYIFIDEIQFRTSWKDLFYVILLQ